jgi:hypothetical protein
VSSFAAEPPAVRRSRSLSGEGIVEKPALLRFGGGFSYFVGGLSVLGSIMASLGLADTSAFRDSPFGSWALPVWGANLLFFGGLLLVIGYGIGKGRPWARPAIVCFWALQGLESLAWFAFGDHSKPQTLGCTWVLFLGVALWYLYGKKNVARYFDALRGHAREV